MTDTVPQRVEPRPATTGPQLPQILGPWDTVRWLWRVLRRMSTALLLLFALAVASIVATFVPQEPVVADTVAQWRAGEAGPGVRISAVFDALDLYDVFGSWWFATLTVLLLVSLTGCLVPRYRAFWRSARRPPVPGRHLERLTNHAVLRTDLPADQALDRVEQALARRRYRRRRIPAERTASGCPQLAAERGHWREGGSLIFHTAFYVLLIGVGIGQAFGFTGQVNVAEGRLFSDTRISYGNVVPGRWFGLEDHRGFVVRLDEFDVSYHPDGTPADFVSTVTVTDDGQQVVAGRPVRVNHPLSYDGMKLYQMRFGMAPRVIVRAGETVLFDDQVLLGQAGGNSWAGVAKLKVSDPQLALDMVLVPDVVVRADDEGQPRITSSGPEVGDVRLFADVWVGDLGLERPVAASEFVREGNERLGRPIVLAEGDRTRVGVGELSVEFAGLTEWSGFQVSHAPGRGVLLAAAVLILVGLIPSLYSYRRRLWAETRPLTAPGATGTEVVLAGVALHRKARFSERFAELAQAVGGALADPPPTRRKDQR